MNRIEQMETEYRKQSTETSKNGDVQLPAPGSTNDNKKADIKWMQVFIGIAIGVGLMMFWNWSQTKQLLPSK